LITNSLKKREIHHEIKFFHSYFLWDIVVFIINVLFVCFFIRVHLQYLIKIISLTWNDISSPLWRRVTGARTGQPVTHMTSLQ